MSTGVLVLGVVDAIYESEGDGRLVGGTGAEEADLEGLGQEVGEAAGLVLILSLGHSFASDRRTIQATARPERRQMGCAECKVKFCVRPSQRW